jgi:anti-sigma regulatory factor (Ser/Thr protein kinase)
MAATSEESTSLIAITLPSTRYSAWMARYYVRAALKHHDLYDYADDAATVTSELVTNAIIHTDAAAIGLELAHIQDPDALALIVTDSSATPPVKDDLTDAPGHGRGLHIVTAVSASWGWGPHDTGKAVYAILTSKAGPMKAATRT